MDHNAPNNGVPNGCLWSEMAYHIQDLSGYSWDLSFDEKVKILDELPNEITVKLQTTLVPYITTISDLTIYNVSHRGKTYTNNLDILNFDFFTVF